MARMRREQFEDTLSRQCGSGPPQHCEGRSRGANRRSCEDRGRTRSAQPPVTPPMHRGGLTVPYILRSRAPPVPVDNVLARLVDAARALAELEARPQDAELLVAMHRWNAEHP